MTTKKIEKLSSKQEREIEKYYKKWLKIGYQSTSDTDVSKAEKAVKAIYKELGLDDPEIMWFDSPLQAEKYIKNNSLPNNREYGNFEANWVGFRDYFNKVLKIDFAEDQKLFDAYCDYVTSCGFAYFYEADKPGEKNLAILCRKIEIERIEAGPNDSKMKVWIKGDDEFKPIYYLNDVVVDEYLYSTKPEDLDIKKFFAEENVEIKREFYRKMGGARFLEKANAKLLDTFDPGAQVVYVGSKKKDKFVYELYEMEIGLEKKYKFLKMGQRDKNGLVSYYLPCVPDQEVTTAKAAFYSIHPHIPNNFFDDKNNKIILG